MNDYTILSSLVQIDIDRLGKNEIFKKVESLTVHPKIFELWSLLGGVFLILLCIYYTTVGIATATFACVFILLCILGITRFVRSNNARRSFLFTDRALIIVRQRDNVVTSVIKWSDIESVNLSQSTPLLSEEEFGSITIHTRDRMKEKIQGFINATILYSEISDYLKPRNEVVVDM